MLTYADCLNISQKTKKKTRLKMTVVATTPAPAWASLSPWMPSRTADMDYWWKLTGQHLATMLGAAGYTIEEQYKALLFHFHWIVGCPFIFGSYKMLIQSFSGPVYGPGARARW